MKKMKKTLLLVLSFALVAVISVTATVAYLSAEDSATNVWTSGKVDIELIEQQRNADRTALEDFEQGKELLPIVGSAQGEKDDFNMPVAANYGDKIVKVENTGRNDAWVRVLVAFPAELDHEDANNMPLHWNMPNEDWGKYNWAVGTMPQVEVEGKTYNVYSFTYKTVLAPGEITEVPAIIGFYLDSRVNYDADLDAYTIDYGNGPEVLEGFDGNIIVPVLAQGVQAGGFATGAEAFDAAFPAEGDNLTKWFNGLGLEVARPEHNAVRPSGYTPEGKNQTINGLTVIDASDETTNLRALYTGDGKKVNGNLTVSNSYLDGTYAMNVIGDDTGVLTVTDTDLRGWVSYDGFTAATFTNVTFGRNSNPEYYNTIRPYSDVTFTNCEFDGTDFWLDKLPEGAKVTFDNCTMNGKLIESADDIEVIYGAKTVVVVK